MMDETDPRIARKLYELTVQLFEQQGEEIKALRQAQQALEKSHQIIGDLLRLTGDLIHRH